MKPRLFFRLTICGALALPLASPVIAHHSTAMFDLQKEVTVKGTVKAWQFVNPHSWLQVVATDPDGSEVQWSLETLGISGIDLHKNSFNVGEGIEVIFNPMRDGRPAGILLEAVSESGLEWKFRFRDSGKKPTG